MTKTRIGNVVTWGSDLEDATIAQAQRAAKLPFIAGHVALMPDAHVGMGATIGSVIPTVGAIIPSAVGVDIGCGMIAVECPFESTALPDDLERLLGGHRRGGPGRGRAVATPTPTPWSHLRQAAVNGPGADRTASGPRPPTRWARSARATTSWRSASMSATRCGSCCTRVRGASATSWPRSTSRAPKP